MSLGSVQGHIPIHGLSQAWPKAYPLKSHDSIIIDAGLSSALATPSHGTSGTEALRHASPLHV
ncbi:hypothetical protein CC80DRAFT_243972 [Byssothecium circinans]|uniref:Uncharacterized protein n=1 Tax=Byssothecium circinans TaxID=147558 RepID=A0A6A5TDE1_9PLEO|nr:hypothetical protein CC80DRAFT_243972 [Byssothecium circinans]